MFDYIRTLTMRVTFTALQSGTLPAYLGSTIRGVMGHSIRNKVCIAMNRKCNVCDRKSECNYALCFCSPGNKGGAVNPFVLHALTEGKTTWEQGDLCIFDITLIGKTTESALFFIDALLEMQKTGWGVERLPFRLNAIQKTGTNKIIWSQGIEFPTNIVTDTLYVDKQEVEYALITFFTPVRIVTEQKLCTQIPFELLIKYLCRRLALLSYAYEGVMVDWESIPLIEEAVRIKVSEESWKYEDFSRYSMNNAKSKIHLPGIRGWALYEGDITPFIPLLEAGHVLHVGKNSTIGMGYYEVCYDK